MAAQGQPLPGLQARVIRDEIRGLGPLPATGRGLRAAADAGAQFAFVCAVDMPLLAVELIDELVAARCRDRRRSGVAVGWPSHYLAAVYRTDLADRIDALVAAGERKMSALIDASDAQQIVTVGFAVADQCQHRRRATRPGAARSLTATGKLFARNALRIIILPVIIGLHTTLKWASLVRRLFSHFRYCLLTVMSGQCAR